MSQAVKHGGIVYLAGQVADDFSAPLHEQMRQVLAKIDGLLAAAGTNKSRLLTVQVFLTHIADFNAMNEVYDRWIDPANPPTRACTEARLAHPDLRFELIAVAALPE